MGKLLDNPRFRAAVLAVLWVLMLGFMVYNAWLDTFIGNLLAVFHLGVAVAVGFVLARDLVRSQK